MEDDERYIETMRVLVEQKYIDIQFEQEGLSSDVLEKQVELNKRRHELNIVDNEEKRYKEFVQ